jgi:hypothetical protein
MVAYLLCRASVSCTIQTSAECRVVQILIIRMELKEGMVVSGRVADLANGSTGNVTISSGKCSVKGINAIRARHLVHLPASYLLLLTLSLLLLPR